MREITSIDEIHAYSIDESCLDVTESLDFFFPEITDKYEQMDKLTQLLQRKIYHQTGLYVTIGMGDNPLLAKLAMDNYAKHNKNMRALIRYEDVPTKIWLITDMTDFWGINVRTEVRLNFLLKHSLSLSDFLQKAKLLHVEVDVSGKYTTYRLTDFEQKRPIRDSSLISKEDKKRMDAHPEKRIFSKEEIERRCEKNGQNHSIVFGQSEIFKEYQKQQKWFKENLGIRLVVEPWQIESKTPDAIRVFVEAGHRKGTVKIESTFIDKVGENFELHLNNFSKFKFLNEKTKTIHLFF